MTSIFYDPYLLDFVYDAENHVIIAECVDWFDIYAENFDINAIEETLYLLVFDENWNQQKQIDTTVPAGADFKAYGPTGCDLILQSDGLYLEKAAMDRSLISNNPVFKVKNEIRRKFYEDQISSNNSPVGLLSAKRMCADARGIPFFI